jgi:hypothetical protein
MHSVAHRGGVLDIDAIGDVIAVQSFGHCGGPRGDKVSRQTIIWRLRRIFSDLKRKRNRPIGAIVRSAHVSCTGHVHRRSAGMRLSRGIADVSFFIF